MNVTFVISSLAAGGAQKILSWLANHRVQQGTVTLLTLSGPEASRFFPLDGRVRTIALGLTRESSHLLQGLRNNIWRILRLRRAIRESAPDVVVSFMDTTNVLTLMSTRGLTVPVVVAERIDPVASPAGGTWMFLRGVTYRFADRIVVQTERIGSSFPKTIRRKMVVIPNPVMPLPNGTASVSPGAHCSIIAIGRLARQKGFDLLLRAFRSLRDRHPAWRLTIVGDGPLRHELGELRRQLGLEEDVDFQGEIANPAPLLRAADLFVLPSRYEGFPNALCEAMACGLACVAADCRTGPREIIEDGINGLLVPPEDVKALETSMDYLMSNQSERQRLGANAAQITSRFDAGKILGRWDSLLEEVTAGGCAGRTGGN